MDNSTAPSAPALDPEKASLVDPLSNARIVAPAPAPAEPEKTILRFDGPCVDSSKQGRGSAVRQILAAIAAQLGTVNTGLVFGFSAIALPQLRSPDSFIKVTPVEESWIASVNAIGTPIGCLFSGYMADNLGRKLTLILTEIPTLLGWGLVIFASNIEMMYAGRFFVGLGSGMVGAPARVYAAEVTQPHLRGMVVAMASVGVSTGVFVEYVLGGFLPWNYCAAISAVIPLVSLILIFLFPETPSYLMSRDRPEKAKRALGRLRGQSCNLEREMDVLVNFKNTHRTEPLRGVVETLRAVTAPNAIKPFVVLALYFLIYQWSGTNSVTFYAVTIFRESGSTMDGNLLTGLLGLVRLIFTVAACILCRRCGRRPLTFVSSIGCGLTMLGLGLYKWTILPGSHTWIPIACIFGYTIFCTLGFLVIPWVMIGEVYPVRVRGIVGGMTTMVAHLSVFSVVKTYQSLKAQLGDHGIYTLYGVIPLLGTIFFYYYLPETRGRSLQEIEDYYSGRTKTLGPVKSPGATAAVDPSPVTAKPIVIESKKGQLLP